LETPVFAFQLSPSVLLKLLYLLKINGHPANQIPAIALESQAHQIHHLPGDRFCVCLFIPEDQELRKSC
jgi:hypothetical protein